MDESQLTSPPPPVVRSGPKRISKKELDKIVRAEEERQSNKLLQDSRIR